MPEAGAAVVHSLGRGGVHPAHEGRRAALLPGRLVAIDVLKSNPGCEHILSSFTPIKLFTCDRFCWSTNADTAGKVGIEICDVVSLTGVPIDLDNKPEKKILGNLSVPRWDLQENSRDPSDSHWAGS